MKDVAVSLLALLGVLMAAGVSRGEDAGLRKVPVAVSRIRLEYGCGPTPAPIPPPTPSCPSIAYVDVVFAGRHCSAGDFLLEVQQRPRVQVLTVFARSDGRCEIPWWNPRKGFTTSTIELVSYDIDPGKPVRVANHPLLVHDPRP